MKCGQYWPLETGRTEEYEYFLVRNVHIEMFQDFRLSHLELFNTQVSLFVFCQYMLTSCLFLFPWFLSCLVCHGDQSDMLEDSY